MNIHMNRLLCAGGFFGRAGLITVTLHAAYSWVKD
jgi:hypothetical protein